MEVDGLKALMENAESTQKAGLEFTSGKIFGKDVVLLECGVGKVNAAVGTQAMIDLFNPDLIISTGIGGSLNKQITVTRRSATSWLSAARVWERTSR